MKTATTVSYVKIFNVISPSTGREYMAVALYGATGQEVRQRLIDVTFSGMHHNAYLLKCDPDGPGYSKPTYRIYYNPNSSQASIEEVWTGNVYFMPPSSALQILQTVGVKL